MGSASRKAFTTQRSSNIPEFKPPKLSKLATAQTIENFLRCFKFRNKELLILVQCFLQCKTHATCSTLKMSQFPTYTPLVP